MKLEVGDKAPAFESLDENGKIIKLSDFIGKKVILFFYPKDMTPTCTIESCNLRDNYTELKKSGFEVIGVSADDEKRHLRFIAKYKLPYHLIADTDKKVIHQYGVWGPKKFMGRLFDGIHRTTFVIDEKGFIEAIYNKVKSRSHTQQILEGLNK